MSNPCAPPEKPTYTQSLEEILTRATVMCLANTTLAQAMAVLAKATATVVAQQDDMSAQTANALVNELCSEIKRIALHTLSVRQHGTPAK